MKTLRLQSIFARVTACMVCLALSLTMIPSASAAQTATAPSWIDKSEYVTFSDGTITTLRNYAQSGGEAPAYGKTYYKECETLSRSTSPSVQFELGLIKLKFALNAVAKGNRVPSSTAFEMACYYAGANDEAAVYQAYVWNARLNMLSCDLTTASDGNVKWFFGAVEHLLGYEQFTMAELLDWGADNGVPTAGLKAVKDLVFVTLDGDLVHPGHVRISSDYMDTAGACIRNDQVMVPVRRLAELMGAVVAQNTTSGQTIVSRASDTITLTPNSKTAYINGAATTLTVVPFMESNQIYVSVGDLADWFGQTVTRSKDKQLIEITEDKSVAGSSNLGRSAPLRKQSQGSKSVWRQSTLWCDGCGERGYRSDPHHRPGLWPHAAGDGLGHHKQRRIVCSSQSTYRIEYNMGSVPRKPSGAVGISVRICDLRGSTGNGTACRRNALQPL